MLFQLGKNITTNYWKNFLEILECGLKIVKLGFQFYTFGEEIAIREERRWGR